MGPSSRFNAVAGCHGKRPYASAGEVRKALANMRRHHMGSGACDYYRCPACGAYHVGKSRRVKQSLPVRALVYEEDGC